MSSLYRLRDVGFHYPSGFRLDGISMDIDMSTITAFVGPNGSGKTSLLNILSFLDYPKKGSLQYCSAEILPGQLEQCRKKIGYVQQNPYLLRGSVFSNIELGLRLRKHTDKVTRTDNVNRVMETLNISTFADRVARTLSGGEARKVAIAQMLALDPEVLILDEPFTHLDKQAVHDLEQLILKLRNELSKSVILTTHDKLQAQRLADQVYSVANNKVFESQSANLFSGKLEGDNRFNTGKQIIRIQRPANKEIDHISIDPTLIVLSREQLESSMQNSFPGKITSLIEENDLVRVSIDAGERFEAVINHQSLSDLNLSIGTDVWISFKSSSILIL